MSFIQEEVDIDVVLSKLLDKQCKLVTTLGSSLKI